MSFLPSRADIDTNNNNNNTNNNNNNNNDNSNINDNNNNSDGASIGDTRLKVIECQSFFPVLKELAKDGGMSAISSSSMQFTPQDFLDSLDNHINNIIHCVGNDSSARKLFVDVTCASEASPKASFRWHQWLSRVIFSECQSVENPRYFYENFFLMLLSIRPRTDSVIQFLQRISGGDTSKFSTTDLTVFFAVSAALLALHRSPSQQVVPFCRNDFISSITELLTESGVCSSSEEAVIKTHSLSHITVTSIDRFISELPLESTNSNKQQQASAHNLIGILRLQKMILKIQSGESISDLEVDTLDQYTHSSSRWSHFADFPQTVCNYLQLHSLVLKLTPFLSASTQTDFLETKHSSESNHDSDEESKKGDKLQLLNKFRRALSDYFENTLLHGLPVPVPFDHPDLVSRCKLFFQQLAHHQLPSELSMVLHLNNSTELARAVLKQKLEEYAGHLAQVYSAVDSVIENLESNVARLVSNRLDFTVSNSQLIQTVLQAGVANSIKDEFLLHPIFIEKVAEYLRRKYSSFSQLTKKGVRITHPDEDTITFECGQVSLRKDIEPLLRQHNTKKRFMIFALSIDYDCSISFPGCSFSFAALAHVHHSDMSLDISGRDGTFRTTHCDTSRDLHHGVDGEHGQHAGSVYFFVPDIDPTVLENISKISSSVLARGGNGANATDGKPGRSGAHGTNGSDGQTKCISTGSLDFNHRCSIDKGTSGTSGTSGENGGDAGVGGIGGLGGQIALVTSKGRRDELLKKDLSKLKAGESGKNGKEGAGGEGGKDGKPGRDGISFVHCGFWTNSEKHEFGYADAPAYVRQNSDVHLTSNGSAVGQRLYCFGNGPFNSQHWALHQPAAVGSKLGGGASDRSATRGKQASERFSTLQQNSKTEISSREIESVCPSSLQSLFYASTTNETGSCFERYTETAPTELQSLFESVEEEIQKLAQVTSTSTSETTKNADARLLYQSASISSSHPFALPTDAATRNLINGLQNMLQLQSPQVPSMNFSECEDLKRLVQSTVVAMNDPSSCIGAQLHFAHLIRNQFRRSKIFLTLNTGISSEINSYLDSVVVSKSSPSFILISGLKMLVSSKIAAHSRALQFLSLDRSDCELEFLKAEDREVWLESILTVSSCKGIVNSSSSLFSCSFESDVVDAQIPLLADENSNDDFLREKSAVLCDHFDNNPSISAFETTVWPIALKVIQQIEESPLCDSEQHFARQRFLINVISLAAFNTLIGSKKRALLLAPSNQSRKFSLLSLVLTVIALKTPGGMTSTDIRSQLLANYQAVCPKLSGVRIVFCHFADVLDEFLPQLLMHCHSRTGNIDPSHLVLSKSVSSSDNHVKLCQQVQSQSRVEDANSLRLIVLAHAHILQCSEENSHTTTQLLRVCHEMSLLIVETSKIENTKSHDQEKFFSAISSYSLIRDRNINIPLFSVFRAIDLHRHLSRIKSLISRPSSRVQKHVMADVDRVTLLSGEIIDGLLCRVHHLIANCLLLSVFDLDGLSCLMSVTNYSSVSQQWSPELIDINSSSFETAVVQLIKLQMISDMEQFFEVRHTDILPELNQSLLTRRQLNNIVVNLLQRLFNLSKREIVSTFFVNENADASDEMHQSSNQVERISEILNVVSSWLPLVDPTGDGVVPLASISKGVLDRVSNLFGFIFPSNNNNNNSSSRILSSSSLTSFSWQHQIKIRLCYCFSFNSLNTNHASGEKKYSEPSMLFPRSSFSLKELASFFLEEIALSSSSTLPLDFVDRDCIFSLAPGEDKEMILAFFALTLSSPPQTSPSRDIAKEEILHNYNSTKLACILYLSTHLSVLPNEVAEILASGKFGYIEVENVSVRARLLLISRKVPVLRHALISAETDEDTTVDEDVTKFCNSDVQKILDASQTCLNASNTDSHPNVFIIRFETEESSIDAQGEIRFFSLPGEEKTVGGDTNDDEITKKPSCDCVEKFPLPSAGLLTIFVVIPRHTRTKIVLPTRRRVDVSKMISPVTSLLLAESLEYEHAPSVKSFWLRDFDEIDPKTMRLICAAASPANSLIVDLLSKHSQLCHDMLFCRLAVKTLGNDDDSEDSEVDSDDEDETQPNKIEVSPLCSAEDSVVKKWLREIHSRDSFRRSNADVVGNSFFLFADDDEDACQIEDLFEDHADSDQAFKAEEQSESEADEVNELFLKHHRSTVNDIHAKLDQLCKEIPLDDSLFSSFSQMLSKLENQDPWVAACGLRALQCRIQLLHELAPLNTDRLVIAVRSVEQVIDPNDDLVKNFCSQFNDRREWPGQLLKLSLFQRLKLICADFKTLSLEEIENIMVRPVDHLETNEIFVSLDTINILNNMSAVILKETGDNEVTLDFVVEHFLPLCFKYPRCSPGNGTLLSWSTNLTRQFVADLCDSLFVDVQIKRLLYSLVSCDSETAVKVVYGLHLRAELAAKRENLEDEALVQETGKIAREIILAWLRNNYSLGECLQSLQKSENVRSITQLQEQEIEIRNFEQMRKKFWSDTSRSTFSGAIIDRIVSVGQLIMDQLSELKNSITKEELQIRLKSTSSLSSREELIALEDSEIAERLSLIILAFSHTHPHGIVAHENQVATLLASLFNVDHNSFLQMRAGEGKTLPVALIAATLATLGGVIHVVTSHEQLARSAVRELREFFKFTLCGSSSENRIIACLDEAEESTRRSAMMEYRILYGTIFSFQDVILDRINDWSCASSSKQNFVVEASNINSKQNRLFPFMILDEVDHILIDKITELRYRPTSVASLKLIDPLFPVLLAFCKRCDNDQSLVAELLKNLIRQKLHGVPDFLSEYLQSRLSSKYIPSAFTAMSLNLLHDFVITKTDPRIGHKVEIIDISVGSQQRNMKYSNGISPMLEILHGCRQQSESLHTVFLSIRRLIDSYGLNITGVTGTLGSPLARSFLENQFRARVLEIPAHNRSNLVRSSLPRDGVQDAVERDVHKWKQVISKNAAHMLSQDRQILIVCEDISDARSIHLAVYNCLRTLPVPDLSGSQFAPPPDDPSIHPYYEDSHSDPSATVNIRPRIIITTNKGGRGIDYKLAPEDQLGLGVILAFRYSSSSCNSRVFEQAIRRAGRQGKPGSYSSILLIDTKLDTFDSDYHVDPATLLAIRASEISHEEQLALSSLSDRISEQQYKEQLVDSSLETLASIAATAGHSKSSMTYSGALSSQKILGVFNNQLALFMSCCESRAAQKFESEMNPSEESREVVRLYCEKCDILVKRVRSGRSVVDALDDPYLIFTVAEELREKGHYSDAEAAFSRSIALGESTGTALLGIAFCMLRQEAGKEGSTRFKEATFCLASARLQLETWQQTFASTYTNLNNLRKVRPLCTEYSSEEDADCSLQQCKEKMDLLALQTTNISGIIGERILKSDILCAKPGISDALVDSAYWHLVESGFILFDVPSHCAIALSKDQLRTLLVETLRIVHSFQFEFVQTLVATKKRLRSSDLESIVLCKDNLLQCVSATTRERIEKHEAVSLGTVLDEAAKNNVSTVNWDSYFSSVLRTSDDNSDASFHNLLVSTLWTSKDDSPPLLPESTSSAAQSLLDSLYTHGLLLRGVVSYSSLNDDDFKKALIKNLSTVLPCSGDQIFLAEFIQTRAGTLRRFKRGMEIEFVPLAQITKPKIPEPLAMEFFRDFRLHVSIQIDEAKDPRPFWVGPSVVFLLGAAQVIVGACLCCSGNPYGKFIIDQGLDDVFYSISSYFSGEFEWNAWRTQKASSLVQAALTFGISKAARKTIARGRKMLTKCANFLTKKFGKVGELANRAASAVGRSLTQASSIAGHDNTKLTARSVVYHIGRQSVKKAVSRVNCVLTPKLVEFAREHCFGAFFSRMEANLMTEFQQLATLHSDDAILHLCSNSEQTSQLINAALSELSGSSKCSWWIFSVGAAAGKGSISEISETLYSDFSIYLSNSATSVIGTSWTSVKLIEGAISLGRTAGEVYWEKTSLVSQVATIIKQQATARLTSSQLEHAATLNSESKQSMNESNFQRLCSSCATAVMRRVREKVTDRIVTTAGSLIDRGIEKAFELAEKQFTRAEQQSEEDNAECLDPDHVPLPEDDPDLNIEVVTQDSLEKTSEIEDKMSELSKGGWSATEIAIWIAKEYTGIADYERACAAYKKGNYGYMLGHGSLALISILPVVKQGYNLAKMAPSALRGGAAICLKTSGQLSKTLAKRGFEEMTKKAGTIIEKTARKTYKSASKHLYNNTIKAAVKNYKAGLKTCKSVSKSAKNLKKSVQSFVKNTVETVMSADRTMKNVKKVKTAVDTVKQAKECGKKLEKASKWLSGCLVKAKNGFRCDKTEKYLMTKELRQFAAFAEQTCDKTKKKMMQSFIEGANLPKKYWKSLPGMDLAHFKGYEAKKFIDKLGICRKKSYAYTELMCRKLHRASHKLDNWGRRNAEYLLMKTTTEYKKAEKRAAELAKLSQQGIKEMMRLVSQM